MANNHKVKIAQLNKEIDAAITLSKKVGDYKVLLKLKRIIVKPGWTTPAEITAALGITRGVREQMSATLNLRDTLVNTAERVGG